MLIKHHKKPDELRRKMVEFFYESGRNASETARTFYTKRQTIMKWIARYEQEGEAGLLDRSRAPHTIPHKLSDDEEQEILCLRDRTTWGPDNLQLNGGVPHSTSVIWRVLKTHGRLVKRKRRYQKKRELAAWKRTCKALRYWQVDVKDLSDIGSLWAFIDQGAIPRYEYTARDVRTGITFLAYASEHTLIHTCRFLALLLEHLKHWNIKLQDVTIQTDNGSEFIGSVYAKEDSVVSALIEGKYGARHTTIPVRTPRFNGSVENFHGRVEVEFYEREYLPTESELLCKATVYLWYYNLVRKNQNTRKTPFELVKQQTHILEEYFLDFPPVILDYLPWLMMYLRTVPHVAEEVTY